MEDCVVPEWRWEGSKLVCVPHLFLWEQCQVLLLLTTSQASGIDCVASLFLAGKWIYEVLISSQGLMQIGWCTLNCRFNQEVE